MATWSGKNIGPRIGVRHRQCFILFFCHLVMYGILHNISLAIVAMTDSSTANPDFEEYDWGEETKATILSGFFWGYMISQIPFGSLATRYGGKVTLLIGVAANSLLNILIPFLTSIGGSTVLFICRILQGIFQGCVYPATHMLLANWSPAEECSRLTILCYPGGQIGAVVLLCTGGLIASSSLGWPGIFYVWGVAGLLWCVVYSIYGANSPSEHKTISEAERDYILNSKVEHDGKTPISWSKVIRCIPFHALTFTHFCHGFGFWLLIAITPTYIKGVFGLDIERNALLSSVPSLTMAVMSQICGLFARMCSDQFKMRHRTLRILFNSIGFGVPALALIVLGFMTSEQLVPALILLTIITGVNAAIYFGYYINHIEICPTHAGLLAGITNSIATINGILATNSVGWLITDETNPKQWQIVFSIGAAFYVLAVIVFGLFCRFKNQNLTEISSNMNTSSDTISTKLNT